MNLSIPYSWIQDYIKIKDTPKNVARKLTARSMSVERVIEKDGETILDIEITTNRPDCASVIGIVREIAAIYNKKFIYKLPILKGQNKKKQYPVNIKVDIKNKRACLNYQAVVLSGMKVASSPLWMQKRLLASGMQPINNIVDITSYVMLECGQPLHSFDYDKIVKDGSGSKQKVNIIVRNALGKEQVQAINKKFYALGVNDLVIADKEKALAIAGISGCFDSAVSDTTTTILLESATFDPVVIRKTSRRINLFTDAQSRFEKKLPPELTSFAILRAIELYQTYCGAKLASNVVSSDGRPNLAIHSKAVCAVYLENAERVIGSHIDSKMVVSILRNLGFDSVGSDKLTVRVRVPWWRADDVTSEIDIIEEIARMYGYEKIKSNLPSGQAPARVVDPVAILTKRLRNYLADRGLTEIYSTTMISEKALVGLSSVDVIKIANPLNDDLAVMRPSLLPSALQAIAKNQEAKDEFSIFELGKVYAQNAELRIKNLELRTLNFKQNLLPEEKHRLMIGMVGVKSDNGFYVLKGIVDTLLDYLKIKDCRYITLDKTNTSCKLFDANKTALVMSKNNQIGVIGEVEQLSLTSFGIKKKTWLVDLDIELLLSLHTDVASYVELLKFPAVKRDMAIIIDKNICYADLVVMVQTYDKLIKTVECFDVYEGNIIGKDKRSIAWHISYMSDERTLEREEVDNIQARLGQALVSKFDAVIR